MRRCEDMNCTVSFTLWAWSLRMGEAPVWGPCWSGICTQRQFIDGERWDPQWLLPGPLKNVTFVQSCVQSSSGEWLSRAPKAAWQKLLLWRFPEKVPPAGHEELLQLKCHKGRASDRGRESSPNRVWEMGKKPQLHLNSSLNPHLAIRGTKTFDLDLPHLSASLFLQRKVLLRFSNRVKGNFLQRSPQTRSASDFLWDINIAKAPKKFLSPTFTFPVQADQMSPWCLCSCTLPGGWLWERYNYSFSV